MPFLPIFVFLIFDCCFFCLLLRNFCWFVFFLFLYYYTYHEFFTPALAGGFSPEFEWQQVTSGLHIITPLRIFHTSILWSAGTTKSIIRQVLLFLLVWSSGRDLYLKIPEKFVRFIRQEKFRVAHISLVRMVKFKFLGELPVDHLPHLVMSSLILLLC